MGTSGFKWTVCFSMNYGTRVCLFLSLSSFYGQFWWVKKHTVLLYSNLCIFEKFNITATAELKPCLFNRSEQIPQLQTCWSRTLHQNFARRQVSMTTTWFQTVVSVRKWSDDVPRKLLNLTSLRGTVYLLLCFLLSTFFTYTEQLNNRFTLDKFISVTESTDW